MGIFASFLQELCDKRIAQLRAALKDACDTCEKCKGAGVILIPGGGVKCSRCRHWRETLTQTKST